MGWLSKPLHSTCPAKVTPGQPGALPLLEPAKREAGVNPEQAGKEGNVPGELLVDARWKGHRLLAEDTRCTTARSILNIEEPAFSRRGKATHRLV